MPVNLPPWPNSGVVEIPLHRTWKTLFEWKEHYTKNGRKVMLIIPREEVADWLEDAGPYRHRRRLATDDDPIDRHYLMALKHAHRMSYETPERKVKQIEFQDPVDAVQFKLTFL